MGMHDIVALRTENPPKAKRESHEVVGQKAGKDTPAHSADLLLEAC
jgi:hypothetical protein